MLLYFRLHLVKILDKMCIGFWLQHCDNLFFSRSPFRNTFVPFTLSVWILEIATTTAVPALTMPDSVLKQLWLVASSSVLSDQKQAKTNKACSCPQNKTTDKYSNTSGPAETAWLSPGPERTHCAPQNHTMSRSPHLREIFIYHLFHSRSTMAVGERKKEENTHPAGTEWNGSNLPHRRSAQFYKQISLIFQPEILDVPKQFRRRRWKASF